MRRGALLGPALASVVALGVGWPASPPDQCRRSYIVEPLTGKELRLDGVPEAAEWPADLWEAGLDFPWRERKAPSTAFAVRVDASALLFAFQVEDHDVVVVDGAPGDESLVARGDRVELFFARDPKLEEYYCIEIDPRGRVLDYMARFYRRFDDTWDCPGLETVGRQRPGGYDVEGRIPLAALTGMGLGEAGTLLSGVFRGEFSHGAAGVIEESWISWVPPSVPEPDFHVPSAFGCFRLPRIPAHEAEETR